MGGLSVVWLAVALLLTGGALLAPADSMRANGGPVVYHSDADSISVVALSGYSFAPQAFENVATNTSIVVNFANADNLAHTFTIVGRQGWVIPNSYTEGQLSTLLTQYPPLFNVQANGSVQVFTQFTSPGPGWYEFLSIEPGQFQSGMFGFIAFGEDLPSNLTVAPRLYPLTFTETTLPPGTNWSVTLTGTAPAVILGSSPVVVTRWSDGASIIGFNVSDGSYSFSASATGYSTNSSTLIVDGNSLPPILVGFQATPSSPITSALDYVVIGVVVVVVALAVVIASLRRRGRGQSGLANPAASSDLGGPESAPPHPP